MKDADNLILLEKLDTPVARVTLNRPDQRNPLDWDTVRRLREIVRQLESMEGIRVVVIKGAGGHFSAGGDLKKYVDLYQNPSEFKSFLLDFHELFNEIENSTKIYVAVVEGYCVAGGLELLLACDVVLAARSAKIGDAHATFGQIPGAGGSQRLPRAIGILRAKYLLFSGNVLSADEAESIGLVSEVKADVEMTAFVESVLTRFINTSPLSMKNMKHLVTKGMRMDVMSGLRMEIDCVHEYATQSNDANEGLRAFSEKRKPKFNGK